MDRVILEGALWFDIDVAEQFTQAPRQDGIIETLFRTRLGAWVMRTCSPGDYREGKWRRLRLEEAKAWLQRQGQIRARDAERFFPIEQQAMEV